jgi:hypothetical protein
LDSNLADPVTRLEAFRRAQYSMVDPLSIAGLTLAVIDQLWKVSERTAELISNFREFDNVGILDPHPLRIRVTDGV